MADDIFGFFVTSDDDGDMSASQADEVATWLDDDGCDVRNDDSVNYDDDGAMNDGNYSVVNESTGENVSYDDYNNGSWSPW